MTTCVLILWLLYVYLDEDSSLGCSKLWTKTHSVFRCLLSLRPVRLHSQGGAELRRMGEFGPLLLTRGGGQSTKKQRWEDICGIIFETVISGKQFLVAKLDHFFNIYILLKVYQYLSVICYFSKIQFVKNFTMFFWVVQFKRQLGLQIN